MKTGSTKNKTVRRFSNKQALSFGLLSLIQVSAFAADKTVPAETQPVLSNPLFMALAVVVIVLAIMIIVFTEIAKAGAHLRAEKEKAKKNNPAKIVKLLALFFVCAVFSNSVYAQVEKIPAVKDVPLSYLGLNQFVFYGMLIIILIEILAAWMLYRYSMHLLGVREPKMAGGKVKIKQASFIEKLNASVAVEEEADIMLDHNYDGIRELDNDLPPWWKYGFYLSIAVAIAYFIHYHVANTGQLPLAEYETQLSEGKRSVEAFRKKSANLVDENNVSLLTDAESLASGKLTFVSNCSACHGKAGEGNAVGPNLTDDYWLHKGGIKDVFRSVKYGWPEKGMKSWQQDLGAKQIHEVASYIKSLHGTNPANAKEKQGELYLGENVSDSTTAIKDSTQVVLK